MIPDTIGSSRVWSQPEEQELDHNRLKHFGGCQFSGGVFPKRLVGFSPTAPGYHLFVCECGFGELAPCTRTYTGCRAGEEATECTLCSYMELSS